MTSEDWEGAICLLVSNLHQPDKKLLQLLQNCVAGQQIASMEALLLKNFGVGEEKPSACAQWLTEMAGASPQFLPRTCFIYKGKLREKESQDDKHFTERIGASKSPLSGNRAS